MGTHKDHLPPLLRGMGFLIILLVTVAVGATERRQYVRAQAKMEQMRAGLDADRSAASADGQLDALTREVRLLRMQLQEKDLSDEVLENPWFQFLGALGTGLITASFLLEAKAKWPGRSTSSSRR